MASDNLLTVHNLRKRLVARNRHAFSLRCDHLTVSKGDRIAVLGKSGAGKSTLLLALAGFYMPDAGSITFEGSPITGSNISRQMVFQGDTSLFFWMTVRENVMFALENARILNRHRGEELLRSVGLEEAQEAWPKELSGGMRKRLELARALATEPKLLLLDEAFGSLDFETRAGIIDLVSELQSKLNFAIVMVTHDLEEAAQVCDRFLFVDDGEVKEASIDKASAVKALALAYENRRTLQRELEAAR